MFWLLVGVDPSNTNTGRYQDYDHFSVYNVPEDESAKLLVDYAARFDNGARACVLAAELGVSGKPSPFVTVAAAPQHVAMTEASSPLGQNGW